jgi:Zn ribbon nucleic-acid-binding protein
VPDPRPVRRGAGMNCPECQAPTRVVATRDKVIRQRECAGKGKHRFFTEEITKAEVTNCRHKIFLLQEIGRLFREGMK